MGLTALAAVLVVIGGFLALRGRGVSPGRGTMAAVSAVAPAGAGPAAVPTGGPPGAAAAAAAGGSRPAPVVPEVLMPLARQAADDYRRRARFPRWSHPLAADAPDPILRDREVTPVSATGPEGAEPTLTVFPAQLSFEAPEPVVVHAFLSIGGVPIPALEITGALLTEDLQQLGSFAYHDDGVAGDLIAGDLVASAELVLPPELLPELSASYLVKVRALTGEDEERLAATSFQYAQPHAYPTGRYTDRIADGNLVVGVEIEVARTGRFHLEGTLYDAGGAQPLVWGQVAAELLPGRHWLDLVFYGLALRELGMDGPYLVRYLALSTTSDMPNAKNRLVENAHLTVAYPVSAFGDTPFDDPDLLEAADRLDGGGPASVEAEG